MADMSDRRISKRANLEVKISYVIEDGKNRRGEAITTNISETGISLKSKEILSKGGKLTMNIILPGSFRTLSLKGDIVWTQTVGIGGYYLSGIHFDSIEEDKVLAIRHFVEKTAP